MKQSTSHEIKEIFRLYLNQQSTPEQEEELFSFINANENSEALFQDIMNEVWNQDMGNNNQKNMLVKKSRSYFWLKYAAMLFLICSVVLGWYILENHHSAPIATLSKTTQRGEKIKLMLPDGSTVYLNALSKLSFPARFEPGKNREIHLEGEAFFEVKHDTSRPFIVHSGALQTRVLGTSFNVNAYPGNKTFNVSVRTGKVAVSTGSNKSTQHLLSLLTPGKHLVYDLATRKFNTDDQKAADFNSWIKNRFIFKNETLGNILTSLKRSYHVNFKVNGTKILSCRFNATFSNKNIKEIADQLQTMSSGNIHYKFNRDKTTITLWGEACQ